eukprot:TRINITY_DN4188_c10_g1_i1.p1 TRINITY_DN4188_c10_g1~~TRINITY_DN4188_c10_g1_i1.p1  ORF type:complete len:582 (-),score=55.88 TRINITY_DN4188_c10_g1_i1:125-1870(-)
MFRRLVDIVRSWKIWRAEHFLFSDVHVEAAFKESQQKVILRAMLVAPLFVAILSLVNCIPIIEEISRDDFPFMMELDDPRSLFIALMLLHFVVNMSLSCFSLICLRFGTPRNVDWELVALATSLYLCLLTPLGAKWHVARLYGRDPDAVWLFDSRGSESSAILALDVVLTSCSLFIPIRCRLLWVLPVASTVALVSMLAAFGSPFPDTIRVNVALFVFLASFSFTGACRHESHSRKQFLAERKVRESMELMMAKDEQLSEASSLVRSMKSVATGLCDIVLQLDAELRVRYDDPVRDALFSCKLNGVCFPDCMRSDEWSRIIQCFERAAVQKLPQMAPVTFESEVCQRFEAKVLIVATSLSMPRYLVGVQKCEFEEIPPPAPDFCLDSILPNALIDKGDDTYEESELSFAYSQTTEAHASVFVEPKVYADACTQTATTSRPPTLPSSNKRSVSKKSRSPFRSFSNSSTPSNSRPSSGSCDVALTIDASSFVSTPESTVAFAVTELCQTVKWNLRENPCCDWHGALEALSYSLALIRKRPCSNDWAVHQGWQCVECFGMNDNGSMDCSICGLDGLQLECTTHG